MALTLLPSNIVRGLNQRPFEREPRTLQLNHSFAMSFWQDSHARTNLSLKQRWSFYGNAWYDTDWWRKFKTVFLQYFFLRFETNVDFSWMQLSARIKIYFLQQIPNKMAWEEKKKRSRHRKIGKKHKNIFFL